MKIYKVNLKNFKGVRTGTINFGDLTVITGKNSSGKSSIIQSLKYLTQWFKRIENTRGLNEFSAPPLNVIHDLFINENKNYEAILNSKSNPEEGISLGIDFTGNDIASFVDLEGDDVSLDVHFDSTSRQGEKVRPKEIVVDTPAFLFGADESKEDPIYLPYVEAAQRAIRKLGKFSKLPEEEYNLWKIIDISFTPYET